jgi:hypothetical protein
MFRSLIPRLRATPPAFTAYETAVLDAIIAALEEPLRPRLAQRLAALTHIRRADGGREVAVAQQAGGRLLYPDETRLAVPDGERLLARFTVSSRRTLSALQGRAWLTNGNFSRLSFTQPTEHAQCDDVHRISVKIDEQVGGTAAPPSRFP